MNTNKCVQLIGRVCRESGWIAVDCNTARLDWNCTGFPLVALLLLLGRGRVEIQWIIFWSRARGSVKRVYCHHNLASGGRCGVRWGDHQDCSNKGRILPTTSYINTKYKCKHNYKSIKHKCIYRAVTVREDINSKKTFSFGHCPNHLSPPPHGPKSGNLVLFFRKSKFKIWKSV